jgi:hypothetical protein
LTAFSIVYNIEEQRRTAAAEPTGTTRQHPQTHLGLGDGVDEVLELVVVRQLGLGDDVVELHQLARHQLGLQ